jgi:peroxiredoxin
MLVDTPICNFGWKVPNFSLKNADGDSFTMQDHLGDKGLLIAFICNHCPYVQRIATRLTEDTNLLLDDGIKVLAIMSNDYETHPDDSPQNMKKFAQQHGFRFPYLVDETQQVGQQFGALCTPEFFGLNSSGELQYRGRLDDARMADAADRVPELVNAMHMIAKTGKGPETQYPSMGCSIKWRS